MRESLDSSCKSRFLQKTNSPRIKTRFRSPSRKDFRPKLFYPKTLARKHLPEVSNKYVNFIFFGQKSFLTGRFGRMGENRKNYCNTVAHPIDGPGSG